MRLLGVVVLYFPDECLMDNIHSYASGLDELIVWQNTPPGRATPLELSTLPCPVTVMGKGINVGLGHALHKAAEYAVENGFTHLLTLDQDSRFEDSCFSLYCQSIAQREELAIYAPNCRVGGKLLYDQSRSGAICVETAYTSGSVYSVELFKKMGFFYKDLFIDGIDIDYCLRARAAGVNTVVLTHCVLLHGFGYQSRSYRFLWKRVTPNQYSPLRSYYIVRNGWVVKRLYPQALVWKNYFYYWFWKRMVFVILYEQNKWAKLKALLYGYIHGKRGITGEQKIFRS